VDAGDTFTARLMLRGTGRVQAVSAGLAWDPAIVEVLSTTSGGFVEGQNGVVFSPGPGAADGALLGVRGQGISGEGLFATVTFRALASGDPNIKFDRLLARDATNHPVELNRSEVAVAGAPPTTSLRPAAPNPFQQTTTLGFSLATRGPVELAVYSVDGRRIRTLVHSVREAGRYHVTWDGRDDHGNEMSAGVYFLRFRTPTDRLTRTITYLR